MAGAITYSQATVDYFHYIATPGAEYLTFVDWLHAFDVHTFMDARMKLFLKRTGIKGNITWAEIKNYVQGKIDTIKIELGKLIGKVADKLDDWIRDLKEWIENVSMSGIPCGLDQSLDVG